MAALTSALASRTEPSLGYSQVLTFPHLHGFPKERVKHDPKTSMVDAVTLDTRLCFMARAPLYLLRVRKEGKTHTAGVSWVVMPLHCLQPLV